jgi:Uncharacterised nucleotidyltransferase
MPPFLLSPVLDALRFEDPHPESLAAIRNDQWPALLARTDHARLTLALGARARQWLPALVRERIDGNLARNSERHRHLAAEYERIADLFHRRGIEFAVLKGAAHWPWFCDHPHHRPQYDFDLWCPHSLEAARAAAELGWEPVADRSDGPTDHLPTMIRRTGWRWRSDYFDPEMPPALEIHFRLWDPATECLDAAGLDHIWVRRELRESLTLCIPALSLPDTLTYAALHALRHLLRGDLCPYHIYELAHFLHRSARYTAFWNRWFETTPAPLRSLAFVSLRLAREWFRSPLPGALEPLATSLEAWIRRYAFSPLRDSPNKDELWLHLALVSGRRARRAILIRRLLPHPPRVSLAPHAHPETALWKLRQQWYRAGFLLARAVYHLRALIASALSAARSSASQISR